MITHLLFLSLASYHFWYLVESPATEPKVKSHFLKLFIYITPWVAERIQLFLENLYEFILWW